MRVWRTTSWRSGMLRRGWCWLRKLISRSRKRPPNGPLPDLPPGEPESAGDHTPGEGVISAKRIRTVVVGGKLAFEVEEGGVIRLSDGKQYVVAGDGSLRRLDRVRAKALRLLKEGEGK